MSIQAHNFEKHIINPLAGTTTIDCLAEHTSLSRQQLKQALQKGCVWLSHGKYTQRVRRAKKSLSAGDKLHIYYNPEILAQQPSAAQLIEDCGDYSIWYKPYGMYSQGSKWGDHCTINRYIEQITQRPAFIVHRLDRAATGLMLIAHKKSTAAALAQLFEHRAISKQYRVTVRGQFPEKEQVLTADIDGRPALSFATRTAYDPYKNRSLLDVKIATGRKHQIRLHMAGAGFPIVGDRLHGTGNDSENLQLCSCYLSFICPNSQQRRTFKLAEELQLAL